MKRKIFSKLLMGAFLIASVSMFVSCKDYDDDISKNAADISALQSQLTSLKSDLTSQLNAAQSELANKASSADVTALAAKVTALETQIKAIDDCASKSDLATLQATVAALTGELDKKATQDDIAKAVEAQNKIQADALDAFKQEVEAKGYLTGESLDSLKNDVKELQDKLSKIDVNAAIDDLKKQSQETLDELTKKVNEEIATMRLFVTGKLTSVVLKPSFYWEGIEAIEVPSAHLPVFTPVKNYEFSYAINDGTGKLKGDTLVKVVVDEVMAAELKNKIGDVQYVVLETGDGQEKVGSDNKYFYRPQIWKTYKGQDNVDDAYYYAMLDPSNLESYGRSLPAWFIERLANKVVSADGKQKGTLNYTDLQKPALVSYHINPLRANIEGAKIVFYENDAEVYTRGGTNAIGPKPVSDTYTKAGEGDKYATNIFNAAEGVLTIPFICENYSVMEGMFSAWANRNNTTAWHEPSVGSSWADPSRYVDPSWDNAHNNYSIWSETGKTDEGKDTTYVHMNSSHASAYGTSNYTDAKGNTYQAAAPLPFIALEMTTFDQNDASVDTVVTSDYAVVVPAVYTIVALADKKPDTDLAEGTFVNKHVHSGNPNFGGIRNNHLYETVGYTNSTDKTGNSSEWDTGSFGAIPMPATHGVAWNDTIDLADFVDTHYAYTTYTKYGQSTADGSMPQEVMDALGLHYEYTAIDYIKGQEKTSESMHIRQLGDKKSGKFTPVAIEVQPDGSGKPYADNHQNRNSIDREPLIRVDLVTEDGKIVRYGYIKLRITDTTADDIFVKVEFGDQYMNCGTEVKMTWAQVEDLILGHKELSENGITKKEFEDSYYLENEGGWEVMPALKTQNFTYRTTKTAGVAPKGTLYKDAADGSWWAIRYYVTEKDGKPVANYAAGRKTENDAIYGSSVPEGGKDLVPHINAFTSENNWFGRVWYTPHDNPTDTKEYDPVTNVLVWNLTNEADASNLNKALITKLMNLAGVTYDSKGLSTKDVSTTVRFRNKTTGKSIFVTLVIPAGKLHFEWGEISNKNWSHWFQMNSADGGVESSTSPYWTEFDTRINPFKPSNVNYRFLTVTDLNNKLTDHWMSPSTMVKLNGGDPFTKFRPDAKPVPGASPTVSFVMAYPQDGLNSNHKDADGNGVSAGKISLAKNDKYGLGKKDYAKAWNVLGASGTVWTLTLGTHDAPATAGNTSLNEALLTAIYAVGKDGKVYPAEEVAYLDGAFDKELNVSTNMLHFRGLESETALYPAATDLLNRMGAYNADGSQNFETASSELTNLYAASFLEDNIDRAFTAYIKINVAHDCYDPLISKQYFNVRFHRPINVAAKVFDWNDRNLADNTIDIRQLVEIVDWNRFPVVAYGSSNIKERNTEFGIEQPKYENVFAGVNSVKQQNLGMPYEFYGIQELAVRYDEIRSDMPKSMDIRRNINIYNPKEIEDNSVKISQIPALFSVREAPAGYRTITLLHAQPYKGSNIVSFDTPHAYNHSNYNAASPGNTSYGKLYFNNDGSDTQLFHIFVPIAVKYNWGNIAWDYKFGEQAKEDGGNGANKLDKDYTQTIWAVIVVNGTH